LEEFLELKAIFVTHHVANDAVRRDLLVCKLDKFGRLNSHAQEAPHDFEIPASQKCAKTSPKSIDPQVCVTRRHNGDR